MQQESTPFRVAVAQINTTVGDLPGNTAKIIDYIGRAKNAGADVVTFPEMAITGYPPEGLLQKKDFVISNLECLKKIAAATEGITAVVGFADLKEDVFNAAAVISGGEILGVHHKPALPNCGVFNKNYYLQSIKDDAVYNLNGITFGVDICQDCWFDRAPSLPCSAQAMLIISSSPYRTGKWRLRRQMLSTRAADNSCFLVYGNLVGGQDELVFDGHSMVFGPDGRIICCGPVFEESLVTVDLNINKACKCAGVHPKKIDIPMELKQKPVLPPCSAEAPGRLEEIYKALTTGIRDYINKNGFKKVALGLSGGIDSAITAVIAADALGAERVVGVIMPSQFSSGETQEDAEELAWALGIEHYRIPITPVFESYKAILKDVFAGRAPDVTEENLQARTRGNILMALSNKFGWLVLTTGNKSELATGYCTLYGDMAGGFSVLKDLPKTLVYELTNYRNAKDGIIPQRIIDRPPSAELRPDQKDVDSLPPYEVLDPVIHAYMEENKSIAEIVAMGYDQAVVNRVVRMIDRNEYKRRQSPPGVTITSKAFGRCRRLPITNKYH